MEGYIDGKHLVAKLNVERAKVLAWSPFDLGAPRDVCMALHEIDMWLRRVESCSAIDTEYVKQIEQELRKVGVYCVLC